MNSYPDRNNKGSHSGWCEKAPDSYLNPHEETKSISKCDCIGKYKI